MRRFSRLLCLLLSVSFLLAPLSTLHVHAETDHHAGALHGGHVHHDASHDQPDERAESVIDVHFAVADRGFSAFSWTLWLPLVGAFLLLGLSVPYLKGFLRPPPRAVRVVPDRTHHWQPPLRGPPSLPIYAR